MTTRKSSAPRVIDIHPLKRVLAAAMLATSTFFIIRPMGFSGLLTTMIVWDVFGLSFLIACSLVLFTAPVEHIRNTAKVQDGSRLFVFLVILIACFSSMITVLLLILSQKHSSENELTYVIVALAGMLISWAIVHTTYAFHYAHLFYSDNPDDRRKHFGGLDFPGDEKPDYRDFLYFSFVIGMTFQVSDVQITSRTIRKKALVHGLLSFSLNTFVVAFTINLIAGLKH